MAFYYGSYGNLSVSEDSSVFIRGRNFFRFVYRLFSGEYTQNCTLLFMTLGVVLLMLTPYLRVVTSVVYFAWRRDFKYVLITAFVLAILTISLAFH
jgi:uncharacterized membrane protein